MVMLAAKEYGPDGVAVLPQEVTSRSKPLRVCMIAYSFYETDNRVMRYAETLAKRGDHVEVFALQRENLPRHEVLDGVHVHRLQRREVNEKGRFSYLARILQFLFKAMYAVSARHLREKYDFIHVHSVPDFLVFAAWLPRLQGTPVVLDIHDILPEFYNSKFGSRPDSLAFHFLQRVEKVSGRFAAHVIVANHIWQDRLLSRSLKPGKCTVLLNSPDRSIFKEGAAKATKSHSGERVSLLYPGSIHWHQGLDLAIRAFGLIYTEVPDVDFHIYGEGPLKRDLVELVQTLHLENRVFFHKPIALREVAAVIARADIGIVPKRSDNFGNEAFSTKIFEFMAVGVPVIVADTMIDKYYFDDSIVHFFQAGNEKDLALRMLELIQDPERRRLQAERAAKFVNQHDWTARKQEYLGLVDGLIPGHSNDRSLQSFS
jgi:glycosyltransferase involved in cell wall biosynthesis